MKNTQQENSGHSIHSIILIIFWVQHIICSRSSGVALVLFGFRSIFSLCISGINYSNFEIGCKTIKSFGHREECQKKKHLHVLDLHYHCRESYPPAQTIRSHKPNNSTFCIQNCSNEYIFRFKRECITNPSEIILSLPMLLFFQHFIQP